MNWKVHFCLGVLRVQSILGYIITSRSFSLIPGKAVNGTLLKYIQTASNTECISACSLDPLCVAFQSEKSGCSVFGKLTGIYSDINLSIYVESDKASFLPYIIKGYSYYKNGIHLKPFTNTVNWTEALATCKQDFANTTLFMPKDADGLAYMSSNFPENGGVLVGIDQGHNFQASPNVSTWKWMDGTLIDPAVFNIHDFMYTQTNITDYVLFHIHSVPIDSHYYFISGNTTGDYYACQYSPII